eukprot:CAMPEP_0183343270 /NCGR_PEP_ID=MMETSP0164_2-20130417/9220_1 /TAXON_ID=221442 /ORGANISM="Coccolithus pelagicus ssp braarudi, Strain PLY182g" /LENGTH=94 /DNA_ID=CAMNT_0025514051 /DNA_START=241 /DNA_END=521 /DNA_ORIENTATION=-
MSRGDGVPARKPKRLLLILFGVGSDTTTGAKPSPTSFASSCRDGFFLPFVDSGAGHVQRDSPSDACAMALVQTEARRRGGAEALRRRGAEAQRR